MYLAAKLVSLAMLITKRSWEWCEHNLKVATLLVTCLDSFLQKNENFPDFKWFMSNLLSLYSHPLKGQVFQGLEDVSRGSQGAGLGLCLWPCQRNSSKPLICQKEVHKPPQYLGIQAYKWQLFKWRVFVLWWTILHSKVRWDFFSLFIEHFYFPSVHYPIPDLAYKIHFI